MDTKQVTEALAKLFEEQRIVFWNDPVLTAVENGGAGRSKMVALGGVDLP